jgi:taurine dioxygenase
MQITSIGETIGAEVTGIDLKQPVDAETVGTLKDALTRHIALAFRDQKFTPPDYAKAVEIFGEPMQSQYAAEFAIDESPMVTTVSNQHWDKSGNRVMHGRIWHSDQTHRKNPPNYTSLYGVTIPSEGGDTGILNTRDGYESLPEEMKARLDKMVMHNLVSSGRARLADSTKNFILAKGEVAKPGRSHPLVREHPDAGTKAIYFHALKIDHIDGMSPEDTREFVKSLLDEIENPKFLYRHKWRKNDLLIWDNRSALHQAFFDYDLSQERLLQRVIIKGTTPFGPAMPQKKLRRLLKG